MFDFGILCRTCLIFDTFCDFELEYVEPFSVYLKLDNITLFLPMVISKTNNKTKFSLLIAGFNFYINKERILTITAFKNNEEKKYSKSIEITEITSENQMIKYI